MTSVSTLVVGGSGMLAELCVSLARTGDRVTVIGRRAEPLNKLVAAAAPAPLHALQLDYTDESETKRMLHAHVRKHGTFDRTVCWTHDEQSLTAPLLFADFTKSSFYQLLASAYANPADLQRLEQRRSQFERAFPALAYHTIVLGFIVLGFRQASDTSRWLSNREISEGTWAALSQPGRAHVIGTISPWSAKP